MKVFEASTLIHAAPDTIWAILTDASQYTTWDPGMIKLEGRIAANEKLTIYAKVAPGRAFHVTVSAFDAPKRMVWSSGMPMGLFKGERTFLLTPQGADTQFSTREEFSGFLLPLIGRTLPDLNSIFATFCAALKARAEG
jgi:hypothetical protein